MQENKLIKYEGNLVQQITTSLGITNKLLALTEPQLIPYRKKDKWGFCTPDKKIVIDPIYTFVQRFSEGLAKVHLDDKSGLINEKGTIVFPFMYTPSVVTI